MKKKQGGLVRFFIITLLIVSSKGYADSNCDDWVARALSIQGHVERNRTHAWVQVSRDDTFCPGDTIQVSQYGRAVFRLKNEQAIVKLDQNSGLTFPVRSDTGSNLHLHSGGFHIMSSVSGDVSITTPHATTNLIGAEIFVRVSDLQTLISNLSGRLRVQNEFGSMTLQENQAVSMDKYTSPAIVMPNPEGLVQWSVYFPQIFNLHLYGLQNLDPSTANAVRQSVNNFINWNSNDALTAFTTIVQSLDNFRLYNLKASMLLSVGRVSEALADLERAHQQFNNSDTYALQSIIALVTRQYYDAAKLAQLAVDNDAKNSTAHLALSYVKQSEFNIEGALIAAQKAVNLAPDSSVAWARLAELWLIRKELDRALQAAQESIELNPQSAMAHIVLGFIRLANRNVDKAVIALQRAAVIDQSNPWSHVGLGIAFASSGDLMSARREFELATNLDPRTSILRSYLGKTYYSEHVIDAAANQFKLAKAFDSSDPTAWIYDALRKQSENKPVEAITDFYTFIERNSKRAINRSIYELDQHSKIPMSNLAGSYKQLGFENSALSWGWKYVSENPSDYSAHRYLAELYSTLPDYEIAYVSELLQAKLFQPINAIPQKSHNLNHQLGIPVGVGFNSIIQSEYSLPFVSNDNTIQVNALAGTQNIFANELSFTGVHDKVSYSMGQSYYQLNGIRQNYHLNQDVYDAFVQMAMSSKSNLQVEVSNQHTTHGDLGFRINTDDYSISDNNELKTSMLRFGYHYSPTPNSDFLMSSIYQTDTNNVYLEKKSAVSIFDIDTRKRAVSTEFKYLHKLRGFMYSIGFGYQIDNKSLKQEEFEKKNRTLIASLHTDTTIRYIDTYLYSHIRYWRNLDLTLGLSFNDYEIKNSSDLTQNPRSQLNPKFGVLWNPIPETTIRIAAFRVLSRDILSDQTIEDAQVAGFNQFFVDKNAVDSIRYGFAVDQTVMKNLFTGMELSWRALNLPLDEQEGSHKQTESRHHAYVSWAPHTSFSLGLESRYEVYSRRKEPVSADVLKEMATNDTAFNLNYFNAGGWQLTFAHSFVSQLVKQPSINEIGGTDQATQKFHINSISVGYRFKQRRGKFILGIHNLFNKNFGYQGTEFQTNNPLTPRFIPQRMVFTSLTFLW